MNKLIIILLCLSLIGYGTNISCDSSDVEETLEELIQTNVLNNDWERGYRFGEAMGLPLLTEERYSGYLDGTVEIPTPKLKIKNIRVKQYNEKVEYYGCAAELEYSWNDRLVKNLRLIKYISYSVEKTTDGDLYLSNLVGF